MLIYKVCYPDGSPVPNGSIFATSDGADSCVAYIKERTGKECRITAVKVHDQWDSKLAVLRY